MLCVKYTALCFQAVGLATASARAVQGGGVHVLFLWVMQCHPSSLGSGYSLQCFQKYFRGLQMMGLLPTGTSAFLGKAASSTFSSPT